MPRVSKAVADLQERLAREPVDFERAMELVLELACSLAGAEGVSLAVGERDEIWYRAATGTMKAIVGYRLKIASSLAGLAMTSGEPILVNDIHNDPRTDREGSSKGPWRSGLVVPIWDAGAPVGVLLAVHAQPGALTEEETDPLRLLALGLGARITRDRAEQMRAELQTREDQLRAFVEESPLQNGIIEDLGDDFRFVMVNDATARLAGKPREALEGRRASEAGVRPEEIAEWLEQMRAAWARSRPVRAVFHRAERVFSTVLVPYRTGPGKPPRVAFVTQDATVELQLREALSRAEQRAAVGRLAASGAHEIKNPLSDLRTNVSFAREEIASASESGRPLPDDIVRALDEAVQGIDRISRLAHDLLGLARGAPQPHLVPVDTRAVIERVLGLAGAELRRVATVHLEARPVPAVKADPLRLEQVLLNLLLNATDAMDAPKEHELVIRLFVEAERVILEVEDSGTGIAPQNLERIFAPFFTTKADRGGSGLGLSTAREIIQAFGGDLRVRSVPGEGSVFRVELPKIA